MDYAFARLGRVGLAAKDYIWRQNAHRSMIGRRKKEAATCSLMGAVAASIKLVQNYILTQFILQTRVVNAPLPTANKKATHMNSGWFPKLPQLFSYGGGAPGQGLGNTFDPTAPFFFVPSESMQALSALTIEPTVQPEGGGDVTLATDLSSEGMESAEYGETNKKANDEPDAILSNTKSVKDAKTNDPKRFTRKGTIYYDSNLHTNIKRDSDSTGTLTDLPATDTLPAH